MTDDPHAVRMVEWTLFRLVPAATAQPGGIVMQTVLGAAHGTSPGSGTTVHGDLTGRDDPDQHPVGAITGLAEYIRDIIGIALTDGTNLDVVVNDAGDTITLNVTGSLGLTLEQVQDAVAAMVAGTHTNITVSYDDTAGTLTFTGGGGGLTAEDVDDRVDTLLVEGANIALTYDDGANTLTVAVTGLAIADITGLADALDALASALDAEATARAAADDALAGALDAEASTRGAADTALDTRVTVLETAPPPSADLGQIGLVDRKDVPAPGATNVDLITSALLTDLGTDDIAWADVQATAFGPLIHPNPIDRALDDVDLIASLPGGFLRFNLSNLAPDTVKALGPGPVTAQSGDYTTPTGGKGATVTNVDQYAPWWDDSPGGVQDAHADLWAKLGAYYGNDPRVLLAIASFGMGQYAEVFQRNFGTTTKANMLAAGYTAAGNRAALQAGWDAMAASWPKPVSLALSPYEDHEDGSGSPGTWDHIDGHLGALVDTFLATFGTRARLQNNSLRSRENADLGGSVSSATASTLVDNTSNTWADDEHNGKKVTIVFGRPSAVGQVRTIADTVAAADRLDVTPDWAVTPTTAEDYVITPASDAGTTTGTAAAGSSTIADTTQSWADDQHNNTPTSSAVGKDAYCTIFTSPRQTRFIIDTEATVDRLTFARPLDYPVPAGTPYVIQPSPREALGGYYRDLYDIIICSRVPWGAQTASSEGVGDHRVATEWLCDWLGIFEELNGDYGSNPGYEPEFLAQAAARMYANALKYPGGFARTVVAEGTATGTDANTLTDSSKDWAPDALVGALAHVTTDGLVTCRRISSNDPTSFDVEVAWDTNGYPIDVGSTYKIIDPRIATSTPPPTGSAALADHLADTDGAHPIAAITGLSEALDLGGLTDQLAGLTVPPRSLDMFAAGFGAPTTTLTAALSDTTGTTVAIADGGILKAGRAQVIIIDSEEILVPAASAGGTSLANCVRGVNGTTAATHLDDAVVRVSQVRNAVLLGDSLVQNDYGVGDAWSKRARRILDALGGEELGLGFRGVYRDGNGGFGFNSSTEWVHHGSFSYIGRTVVYDIAPRASVLYQAGAANYGEWFRPTGETARQIDVYWGHDPTFGGDNWSYSLDGGSSWIDNPNTSANPATHTLKKTRIACNNPTSIQIRAANAAGTGDELFLAGVDVWNVPEQFGQTRGYKIHNLGCDGDTIKNIVRNRITVTDAVTNGTITITSADADFVASHVGCAVRGTNIPDGTTIDSVTNESTAELSQAASGSGSGGKLWIQGSPGDWAALFDQHPASLVPELIILGPFSNDAATDYNTAKEKSGGDDEVLGWNLDVALTRLGFADILAIAPHEQGEVRLDGTTSTAVMQQAARTMLTTKATEYGKASLDVFEAWTAAGQGSYADALAAGLMGDFLHAGAFGSRDYAARIVRTLLFFGPLGGIRSKKLSADLFTAKGTRLRATAAGEVGVAAAPTNGKTDVADSSQADGWTAAFLARGLAYAGQQGSKNIASVTDVSLLDSVLSIPAVFAAGDKLEIEVIFNLVQSSGANRTFVPNVKIGSTSVHNTITGNVAAGASARTCRLLVSVLFTAVNAQRIFTDFDLGGLGTTLPGGSAGNRTTTTAAEDFATAKNFDFLILSSAATATQTAQVEQVTIRHIPLKVA